ncbi:Oncosphere antigen A, partial [Taenia solium]|eukprot:TsM_000574100 transcript=TsM_000574100 gene=TsM_000574100
MFEAKYYEEIGELNILIYSSEDEFLGFEVLLRVGDSDLENEWHSVLNLTAEERECQLEGLTSLVSYSVTVRGLSISGSYSYAADPLVFKVLNKGLSVPRDVELEAIDPNTVLMLWEPPDDPNGYVAGYIIEWILDSAWQQNINLSISDVHLFTELVPNQNLSAAVYARIYPKTEVKLEYLGSRSAFQSVTTRPGRDLTVPQNVELNGIDPHTVVMTWDPPKKLNGPITGYTIKWRLDKKKQRTIHLFPSESYIFTGLRPRASLSAS